MKENEKVRGLLDIAGSDACLSEQALTDLMLGLGWGATDQARRWALIGFALEEKMKLRRPAHRPKQDPITHKDAIRAFAAWQMCWKLRGIVGNPKARISSRELTRIIQIVENALGLNTTEKLFPKRGNLDASLSSGKKILEIDDDWNSKVCEEVQRTLSKTTG
jgi:hypothetical protein